MKRRTPVVGFPAQSRFDRSIARYHIDHRTANRPEFHLCKGREKKKEIGGICAKRTRSFSTEFACKQLSLRRKTMLNDRENVFLCFRLSSSRRENPFFIVDLNQSYKFLSEFACIIGFASNTDEYLGQFICVK